ncbi:CoA-disulfide reductase [Jeotgalibacillus soli]|uniref:CoA-disulfide reductase n=1 Tax=Jeotgalibacillus soli TaxID=889306 RepID=A0A0C2V9M8_9BACL|nr:CoA-disulfide reductase [Jeotgalibacillus soli]KIL45662.1 hypothetical protein KP78_20110 [Jeotgalibacillus soli]
MKKKVLVIGGVAGGATFASQLRILDDEAEIIVFEKDGTMSFANCGLPYYLGGVVKKEEQLIAATPESFSQNKNIEVRVRHEIIKIDRPAKKIIVQDHIKNLRYEETYDQLILSPGATPVVPEIEGLAHARCYTLRTFEDMLRIDQQIKENNFSSVCIVGGGFIGLEMAENFKARGLEVFLLERSSHVMKIMDNDMGEMIEKEIVNQGVHVYTDTTIKQIENNGRTMHLSNRATIHTDFLLLAVGVKPNTALAEQSNLEIGITGGIKVNSFMQTSDPDVYAVGDAIETIDFITHAPKRVPLAWVTHREAYIAARHITEQPLPFKGVLGTSICKVFDLTVSMLGHSEQSLTEQGIPFKTITHYSRQHAGYYPGSEKLTIKVHFSEEDGKIYGVQIIGKDGVDKRMDILSTAIKAGLSVTDLQEIEVAYAPPFSAPKDPINMIGYKAYPIVKNK